MARRNIFMIGDEILRKKCRAVDKFDERTNMILDDLRETLEGIGGLGLAAPQVGVLRRIAIVKHEEEFYEIINPIVISSEGESVDNEGCLSVKGYRGIVKRPKSVVIEYKDRNGETQRVECEGYKARIFLHEIDHLDGVLFVDKMISRIDTAKKGD